eukprot:364469-Chlamydomonas_euryale.AAC.3
MERSAVAQPREARLAALHADIFGASLRARVAPARPSKRRAGADAAERAAHRGQPRAPRQRRRGAAERRRVVGRAIAEARRMPVRGALEEPRCTEQATRQRCSAVAAGRRAAVVGGAAAAVPEAAQKQRHLLLARAAGTSTADRAAEACVRISLAAAFHPRQEWRQRRAGAVAHA